MIVKIDKLSHDMRGIAKVDGKVMFVDGVLPGEVVDTSVITNKKSFSEGKLLNVIDKSANRIDNVCPYSSRCGGCNFGYCKMDSALDYKVEVVEDIINKYAGYKVNLRILSNYKVFGYRNKITLRVSNNKLALLQENSNSYVNINRCNLVNDNINRIIELLNNMNLDGLNEVIIKGDNELMVILNGNVREDIYIKVLEEYASSIVINDKVVYGNDYISINVGKYKYAIYPKSFFQVNTDMIDVLYSKVLDYAARGDTLLDLYCGAGTIGIYLAKNFKKVLGIEVNHDAVLSANVNKKLNNIDNIEFECKRASDICNLDFDVAVVDPPRDGLDKITINKLLKSSVKKIVYVSCNPLTLARDLKLLKDKFVLEDITLVDMFPNTRHVESVCALKLK